MKYITHTLPKTLVATLVLGSIILSPSLSFAKGNEKNDDHGNSKKQEKALIKEQKFNEKMEKKQEKFEKKIEDREFKFNRGIFAEFWNWYHNNHGNGPIATSTATSTVATTTLPVISNATVKARQNGGLITWNTNTRTDSTVFYGTSTPVDVNASTTASVTRGAMVYNHEVSLRDLTASTTYYAVIRSKDASGNVVYSNTLSFTTTSTPTPPVQVVLPVISNGLAVVGTSTVGTSWATNIPATSKVYYGTSTPIDVNASTTANVSDSTLVTNHAVTVSGLATSTQYYMILQSTDAAGHVTATGQFSFTTGSGM